MSGAGRFDPPAAEVADLVEAPGAGRFGPGAAALLAAATLVQLALAGLHVLPWLQFVVRGGAPPLNLLLGAAAEGSLVFAAVLMARRWDRGRFAFLLAMGLIYLHRMQGAAAAGYVGKWAFLLGLAIATTGWIVVRRRRRVIARGAVAAAAESAP